jgi:hypothetical protein
VTSKGILFTVLFTGILIIGSSQAAFGAQLEALVDPNKDSAFIKMKYQRTVFIEYNDGGQLADILRNTSGEISISESTPHPDVVALRDKLNQKMISDGSNSQISDLTVDYTVTLTGRSLNTAIDYKLVLTGKLVDYVIVKSGGQGQALVDMGWRGISTSEPVMINGQEINLPISAIQELAPTVHANILGTEAETVLSTPLINGDGILNQPMTNWHFLFDPTGIGVDAGTFGLDESIQGFVLSGYTMGESSIREGRQVEQEVYADFTVDRTYAIRTVQSADSANMNIIGFAALDKLENLEIVGVTPRAPEGYAQTSTGGFPVMIIYGMAGLAVVGGVAFFVFSNRALKKEAGQGQTGIDPSRLTGYQTSASAGGYQTNRGEAQLTDDSDYAQTRSVYDDSLNTQQQNPPPTVSATPEAACGCAASEDSGNECDCEMQGQCFCDAACGCSASICKDNAKAMQ